MTLKTLEGIGTIGGYDVVDMPGLRGANPGQVQSGRIDRAWFSTNVQNSKYVYVDEAKDSLEFKVQKGKQSLVGVNGCEVDTIILAAKELLSNVQNLDNCRAINLAKNKLDGAVYWLAKAKIELGL